MAILKDMWRVGVALAPLAQIVETGAIDASKALWVPGPGSLRFLADPFGLWRDGRLHLFVETYDYRDRVGAIEVLTYDADLTLRDRRLALKEPWHLSYPFLIEDAGETWMLPEAHKSGRLTLYRAEDFPHHWAPHTVIELDEVAIDATPVFHDGLWWLFYTPATTKADKVSALHVAWAPRLTGPWTPHRANPVRHDAGSTRPGGTPFVRDGALVLPVQDCRKTYGGGIRLLTITTLTPDRFEADVGEPLRQAAGFEGYTAGLHTLSAAGPVTLFDAKKLFLSPQSLGLDVGRLAAKLGGKKQPA